MSCRMRWKSFIFVSPRGSLIESLVCSSRCSASCWKKLLIRKCWWLGSTIVARSQGHLCGISFRNFLLLCVTIFKILETLSVCVNFKEIVIIIMYIITDEDWSERHLRAMQRVRLWSWKTSSSHSILKRTRRQLFSTKCDEFPWMETKNGELNLQSCDSISFARETQISLDIQCVIEEVREDQMIPERYIRQTRRRGPSGVCQVGGPVRWRCGFSARVDFRRRRRHRHHRRCRHSSTARSIKWSRAPRSVTLLRRHRGWRRKRTVHPCENSHPPAHPLAPRSPSLEAARVRQAVLIHATRYKSVLEFARDFPPRVPCACEEE